MGVVKRGKIQKSDLLGWDGKTLTGSRVDATGGTVTGLVADYEVDVLEVFGSSTNYTLSTISQALQHIGSSNVTLVFAPGTWVIDDDLTIDSNLTCRIPAGCTFDVASGKTLTISGAVLAQASSWWSGSGTVNGRSSIPGVFFVRTAAEISASIWGTDHSYKPVDARRYGTNTTPGTTDMTTAIQAAIDVGAQDGVPGYLPAAMGEARITSPLAITSGRSGLVGDGDGMSRLLVVGVNGFNVSAGLSFVRISGMTIALAVRYTTTPNSLTGIAINGTTASQTTYVTCRDLFIDGFQDSIKANGVTQSTFEKIETLFCFGGLKSAELSFNNAIIGCRFVTTKDSTALSYGIKLGNGVDGGNPEGWWITSTLIFGFARGIWGLAADYVKVTDVFIDSFGEFGIVLESSATDSCVGWEIKDPYIAASAGATADTGIFLSNSITPNSLFDNGHRIIGANILVYAGGTLTNGILSTGTDEIDHTFDGNRINADSFDLKLDANCTAATVVNNHADGPGYFFSNGCNPIFDNNRGTIIGGVLPDVASAAAVTLPIGPDIYKITGTTDITSIVATGHWGRRVTLIFGDILTFTDGSNLKLEGNLVTTANDTITLVSDGTSWFEVSRSVN